MDSHYLFTEVIWLLKYLEIPIGLVEEQLRSKEGFYDGMVSCSDFLENWRIGEVYPAHWSWDMSCYFELVWPFEVNGLIERPINALKKDSFLLKSLYPNPEAPNRELLCDRPAYQ